MSEKYSEQIEEFLALGLVGPKEKNSEYCEEFSSEYLEGKESQ